jgi:hypothetical protein
MFASIAQNDLVTFLACIAKSFSGARDEGSFHCASWQKGRDKHLENGAEYVFTEEIEAETTRTLKFAPRFGAVAGYETGKLMCSEDERVVVLISREHLGSNTREWLKPKQWRVLAVDYWDENHINEVSTKEQRT